MTLNDTTILKLVNSTTTIAHSMSSQTETYLWASIFSSIAGFAIYFLIFYQPIRSKLEFIFMTHNILKKIAKLNNRNVLVMAHRQTGFFGSMITMEDIITIEKLMRKFAKNQKGIDFIIHTFGGELFASMRLALLIKNHPNIHVYVPKFAWSGGSLATIASKDIHMGNVATLSPVDAQLGNIIQTFSAKYWQDIVETKGNKAKDETIAYADLSKQILEEQKQFLDELLVDQPNIKKEEFIELFLMGAVTHGKQITPAVLKELGFKVSEIKSSLYDELIESHRRSGVFGFNNKDLPKWLKRFFK